MSQIEATNGACVLMPDNGAYDDTTPGSAGGHCLLGRSSISLTDADTVDLLTWGPVQKVNVRLIGKSGPISKVCES